MWNTAVAGGTAMPPQGDTSSRGMRDRLGVAAPNFRRLVMTPAAEGRSGYTASSLFPGSTAPSKDPIQPRSISSTRYPSGSLTKQRRVPPSLTV